MTAKAFLLVASVVFLMEHVSGHSYNAVETQMFSIPISPNMFNWTYQEFDEQYRFHASLKGKPELPSWLRYIYSGRHHSGFIFGTPPPGTKSPIDIVVIGVNRQDFECRQLLMTLSVQPKLDMAHYEVEMKIDNLNVEDLLDEHRMVQLKEIFRTKLWLESADDLYPTFLASAIDLGARLPLKPNEGEGLVVRFGSSHSFSAELRRLREEVRPLSRLPRCPRDYKRTTVERLFRDAGLSLDWCNFELYHTIYKNRSTEILEYLSEIPNEVEKTEPRLNEYILPSDRLWYVPMKFEIPTRGYEMEYAVAILVPLMLLLITVLLAVITFQCSAIQDEESDRFLNNIFHICIDCRQRRVHKLDQICDIVDKNLPRQPVSLSSKSSSPNNSLPRAHSPRSANLAGSYNRPLPPPYTNTQYQRKANEPDPMSPVRCGLTDLVESLNLLNEAKLHNNMGAKLVKDPIIDLEDGTEDYVGIKPDSRGHSIGANSAKKTDNLSMNPDAGFVYVKMDLDDIDVPELAQYGLVGVGKPGKTWFC